MAGKWANNTKKELQTVPINDGFITASSGTGGKEPVRFYYKHKAPKTPTDRTKVLEVGQEFNGFYEGTYVDKYGKANHKVRTDGLDALPECKGTNEGFAQAKPGTEVKVVFNGESSFLDQEGNRRSMYSWVVRYKERATERPEWLNKIEEIKKAQKLAELERLQKSLGK